MHLPPSSDGTTERFGAIRQQHRKMAKKQPLLDFERRYDQDDGNNVSN